MYSYVYEEKEDFEDKRVKVLGPTYEEGRHDWQARFQTPELIFRGNTAELNDSLFTYRGDLLTRNYARQFPENHKQRDHYV
jgi:hypothetical protein